MQTATQMWNDGTQGEAQQEGGFKGSEGKLLERKTTEGVGVLFPFVWLRLPMEAPLLCAKRRKAESFFRMPLTPNSGFLSCPGFFPGE